MNYFDWFNAFHLSFFVRMLLIFTAMMLFYNRVDKDGLVWKVAEWPWKAVAAIFFVVDIIYNHYSTLYFFDKAAAWDETFSYRMKRYITLKPDTPINKWRYYFAVVMQKILNFSDSGHI